MTTQWAAAHKAEQRSMARRAWCNRAHSAVTQKVNAIEEGKVNGHAAFLKFTSGQLQFLVWCCMLDGTHKTDGFLVRARRKPQQ
ncbi:hypothetical protein Bpro_1894 [Polaromonas sp. JS666]|nr:hypothetical protein Bpro_1894 [Polaromonas sp. JS666]